MMRRCWWLCVALLCGLVFSGSAEPRPPGTVIHVGSAEPRPPETVVLISLQNVSLDDLCAWNLPAVSSLLSQGAVGLLNNKVALQNNKAEPDHLYESAAVTIGAGTRGIGYGSLSGVTGECLRDRSTRRIGWRDLPA